VLERGDEPERAAVDRRDGAERGVNEQHASLPDAEGFELLFDL